jgi:hypothetical protein
MATPSVADGSPTIAESLATAGMLATAGTPAIAGTRTIEETLAAGTGRQKCRTSPVAEVTSSASNEIVSAYAQPAHAISTQKSIIKVQFSTLNNRNFEKPSRISSNRTKVNKFKKMPNNSQQKNGFAYAQSQNVRTSKFGQKSKRLNKIM